MKENITAYLLILFFISTAVVSCKKSKKETDCVSYQIAPITKVEGPNAGLINENIHLTVSFDIFSGCARFGNFDKMTDADTTIIKINAEYKGCVCTQLAGSMETTYTFKTPQPGTYYFKFFQNDLDYLSDSIVIH